MTVALGRSSAPAMTVKRGAEPRYDLQALLDRVDLSLSELAVRVGRSRAHVYRRFKEGVTWSEADEWAVEFRMLPWEVWPEWTVADPTDWCTIPLEDEKSVSDDPLPVATEPDVPGEG